MSALPILAGIGLMLLVARAVAGRRRETRQIDTVLAARLRTLAPSIVAEPSAQALRLGRIEAGLPPVVQRWIARADVAITARHITIFLAVLLAATVAGGELAGWPGACGAAAAGTALPLLILHRLADRRINAFIAILPHFLDSIRQLLAVGNSFQQALIKSVEASAAPVQRYLLPAVRRLRNGASVPDALEAVAERIDLAEFHMVVATVRTNARFGGTIGPTLAALSGLLRDRARVVRELSAASAETRTSAFILCALPPVAMLIISVINFDYMKYLWETDGGRHLLTIGFGFQVLGMLTMRRLMRLDF